MKSNLKKQQSWQMFNIIAARYEVVNDILSCGIHRAWRQTLVRQIPQKMGQTMLDCATGTGSIVFAVMEKCAPYFSHVTGSDLSEGMMAVAKKKCKNKKYENKVEFCVADACSLPMNESAFDVVSMAFGIRNVPDYKQCLTELFRVLKQDGKVLILEFSMPKNKLVKWVYLVYFRYLMPMIGGLISGKLFAYKYLNQTVESFPYGAAFKDAMCNVGFKNVIIKPLTFGIATLYIGEK